MNGIYVNSLLTRFLNRVVEGLEQDFKLKGKVQLFPVINIQAAQSGCRAWSFDDLDFDLAFPGNHKGEMTERIARAVVAHTSESTHGVILKTAHHLYEDATHIQVVEPDRPTKKMAQSLGLNIARKLPDSTVFPLSLFGHWRENDIPSLVISAGKPRALDRSLAASIFKGLVNLMASTGVLTNPGNKKEMTQLRIYPAKTERNIISSHAGMFVAEVQVGSFLQKGQKIGEMKSIDTGATLEEFAAPVDGHLITLRHYPVTFEKESIATLLSDKKQGFWPF